MLVALCIVVLDELVPLLYKQLRLPQDISGRDGRSIDILYGQCHV